MFTPVVNPQKKHYGANFWDCYSVKLKRDVHFYSELEYDYWIHIETNKNIVDFCEKPIKISEFIDGKKHESVIDMWLKWENGKEEFIEVAYKKDIEGSKSTIRRITLHKQWSLSNNVNYRFIDETEIRKQPLLDNLKVMLPYLKEFKKVNDIINYSILKTLQEEAITIQALFSKLVHIDSYTLYLHIFYLYYQDKININIEEQHFNHLSKVWKKDG